jgi:hypothetical protein
MGQGESSKKRGQTGWVLGVPVIPSANTDLKDLRREVARRASYPALTPNWKQTLVAPKMYPATNALTYAIGCIISKIYATECFYAQGADLSSGDAAFG